MAEENSLGEGIALGTSLPPTKWGIAQGVGTGLQMKLRSDMVEAQQNRYQNQLKKAMGEKTRKLVGRTFQTPGLELAHQKDASKLMDPEIASNPMLQQSALEEFNFRNSGRQTLEANFKGMDKVIGDKKIFIPNSDVELYREIRSKDPDDVLKDPALMERIGKSHYISYDPENFNISLSPEVAQSKIGIIEFDPAKTMAPLLRNYGKPRIISGVNGEQVVGMDTVEKKIDRATINQVARDFIGANPIVVDQVEEKYKKDFDANLDLFVKANPDVDIEDARINAAEKTYADKLDDFSVKLDVKNKPRPIKGSNFNVDTDGGVYYGDKRVGFNVIDVPIVAGSGMMTKGISLLDRTITVDGNKYNVDNLKYSPSKKTYTVEGQYKDYYGDIIKKSFEVDDNVLGQIAGKDISVKDLKALMRDVGETYSRTHGQKEVKKVAPPPPKGKAGGLVNGVKNAPSGGKVR